MSSYGQGGTRLWRRIRQDVLDRDHHECQLRLGGCTFIATEVHHTHGIAAAGMCRAEAVDLDLCVAVCRDCHAKVTNKQRAIGQAQAAALRRQRLHPTQPHPGELRGGHP
jgi:5-methylcytosine-specific restriction protein A